MSNISNEDLDALLGLARAATPGDWQPVIDANYAVVTVGDSVVCCAMHNHNDARFIAAASPATITALVQQLQEAQRDAKRYQWLRGVPTLAGNIRLAEYFGGSRTQDFDAAIDAAVAKERQP